MKQWKLIQVSSYAGYRANQRPLSFVTEKSSVTIVRILKETLEYTSGTLYRMYTVHCSNDKTVTIRNKPDTDLWELCDTHIKPNLHIRSSCHSPIKD